MSSSQASPTQSSAPSVSNKPVRILACVLCQHRKIKCDRQFPCFNCQKANQKCTPSTPAPARKRRRPNQDLQERLARCEELLKEYTEAGAKKEDSVEKEESPASTFTTSSRSSTVRAVSLEDSVDWGMTNGSVRHGPGSHSSNASAQTRQLYKELSHHGRLVKEDGGTRFMDSIILGTIYDELRAMREIVNADENDENTPDTATPDDNSELILGADTPSSISPVDLWPDAGHVFRLWQIYLDRVNPLTKIIHVPTLQPYVAEATSGCSNLPKNIEALLFSIWLMAAVAMSPDECQALLGYSRDSALQRFSGGVRMALIRLNFLKSHDMTALQALVIYLISLQGRYNRHAAWILNGVVIRIAQKMGLHRDGETLGLGPFECEMRRRLWWQIIMLDAKYAMMTGLNHSLLPRIWDTKEPKNLNDVDMFPTATEPFQDRDGPTEMIFVMITNKVARFLVETPGLEIMLMLAEWSGAPATNPQLIEFRTVIGRLGQDMLDMLNKYCDPSAGPVHEMAVEVKAQIIKKLSALATSAKDQPEWGSEILDSNDNAFKLAICAMEHEQENCYASQDKGFLWHALLHFQLDVFIYLAGQLCHRLDGALVDRAWKQVEVVYYFHPELYDTSNNKTYFMLARFILRAWSKREDMISRKTGHVPSTPPCIEKLRSIMPCEDVKSEPTAPVRTGPNFMSRPQLDGPDPSFDQFLGGFLDVSSSDWDMFAGMPINGQNDMPPPFYGMNPSGW